MRKSGKSILFFILAAVLTVQPSWKVLAEEVQTDQNVSEEAEMTEEEKQAAE